MSWMRVFYRVTTPAHQFCTGLASTSVVGVRQLTRTRAISNRRGAGTAASAGHGKTREDGSVAVQVSRPSTCSRLRILTGKGEVGDDANASWGVWGPRGYLFVRSTEDCLWGTLPSTLGFSGDGDRNIFLKIPTVAIASRLKMLVLNKGLRFSCLTTKYLPSLAFRQDRVTNSILTIHCHGLRNKLRKDVS